MMNGNREILVHLASGIGNIVFATPMLVALGRQGFHPDVLVDGDYSETADLLRGWSALRSVSNGSAGEALTGCYEVIVPSIPPFYWQRYARRYAGDRRCVRRPPDALFYRDEQNYYLEFARTLGREVKIRPYYFLPIGPGAQGGITSDTLVLAPGCKTGEMGAKRWPHFPELAERFEDVALVGTPDDLRRFDGTPMTFPPHVRCLAGKLSLRQTAETLAAAGAVVANDSGLGHIAGAVGAPTVMLFGPTPDRTLGPLPPNVRVIRSGLGCEPCWFNGRFGACHARITCLEQISTLLVETAVRGLIPGSVAWRKTTALPS